MDARGGEAEGVAAFGWPRPQKARLPKHYLEDWPWLRA